MLGRIATPSLLRVLVFRTATVSIFAALVIVFVAQYVSNSLVQSRFQDEAGVIASTATSAIDARVVTATRGARFVAGLPTTKRLAIPLGASHTVADTAAMQSFLIFAKASNGADILSYADANGSVITGARTSAPARSSAPTSWPARTRAPSRPTSSTTSRPG